MTWTSSGNSVEMANLWQFFGLPDPDGPEKNNKKKDNPVTPETRPEPIIDEPIPKKSHKTPEKLGRWQGPTTPDGESFHDLGDKALKNRGPETTVQRGLRYIVPDDRHRLPLEGMESRLNQGDVLIVDLRNLVHMDAHQNACRRLLRELADSMSLPAFSLDEEERILLMPGIGITIDINNHSLGLEPMIS